jgi:hypothetical protein
MELIGVPCGAGVLTYPDGCCYEGTFEPCKKNDRTSEDVEVALFRAKRHGKGSFQWPDGKRFDGDWSENSIHGVGTMTWPDGRKFAGSFCCNSPEKGILEEPSGTWNVRFETKINLLQNQELPEPDSRREIGRIPTKLWTAITNSSADSYCVLGATTLCAADRARVKMLHTAEKSFKRSERVVFGVEYAVGLNAGQDILRAFSGDLDKTVITKMQWAIIPNPSIASNDGADQLQEMFRIAQHRMPGFKLTVAGSIQPDPLATRDFDQLRSSYVAAGRMVGAALWHGKTFQVPFARFFCRRVLDMVVKERLKAYSTDFMTRQSAESNRRHNENPFNGTFPSHFGCSLGCCGQPGTYMFEFVKRLLHKMLNAMLNQRADAL